MNIIIREAEGGYYIKLSGSGKGVEEWVTEDKEEVVRIVREKFLRELSPDDMRILEEGMIEEEK